MKVKAPIGAATFFLPTTLPGSCFSAPDQTVGAVSLTCSSLQLMRRVRRRVVVRIATARPLNGIGSTIRLGQLAQSVCQSFVQLVRSVAPRPVAAGATWGIHAR